MVVRSRHFAYASLLLTGLLASCSGGGGGGGGFGAAADSDGDGLPNALELSLGSDPDDPDDPYVGGDLDVVDEDGPPGDGISDGLENYLLSIGTPGPVVASRDLDGDDIPDYLEVRKSTSPTSSEDPFPSGSADILNQFGPPSDDIKDGLERFLIKFGSISPVTATSDTDRDGLSDVVEVRTGTNPYSKSDPAVGEYFDVDEDGVPDYYELLNAYDPYDGDRPVIGGGEDADGGVLGPDGDGITDALEFVLTDQGAAAPLTARSDTDGDGLPDSVEIRSAANPFDSDSPLGDGGADTNNATGPAGDGISDALEFYLQRLGASGAISALTDTDTDGIPDVLEVRSGTDPFDVADPNTFFQADVDGDGVPDVREVALGTDPLDVNDPVINGGADTNDGTGVGMDRLSDGLEGALIALGATAPVSAQNDRDGDGVPDWLESLRFSDLTDSDSPTLNGDMDTAGANGPAGDGISDALEDVLVALGASAPVGVTTDSDGDGIGDALELRVGTNPFNQGDPVPNLQLDLDGDGAPDYLELTLGSDPLDVNDPAVGGAGDSDLDRVLDGLEQAIALIGGDQPVGPNSDTDGDGLPDVLEVALGSDFLDMNLPVDGGADTVDSTGPSGDGLSDAMEFYLLASGASLPITRRTDQDLDGAPGYLEAMVGGVVSDDNSPVSMGGGDTDLDGVTDTLELVLVELGATGPISRATDSDGDGAPDYLEVRGGGLPFDGTDPSDMGAADSDGDGLSDGLESILAALGAGLPVNARSDSDLDSIPDYFEVQLATDPFDNDIPVAMGDDDTNDTTGPAGDTIMDGLEQVLIDAGATQPVGLGTDTDSDGAADYLETIAFTDFLDGNSPVVSGSTDSDGDGMSDGVESVLITLGATAPIDILSDTDTDGAPDYIELELLGHPVDANHPAMGGAGASDDDDTQGPPNDGISDALEALLVGAGASAPISPATDSDGDGLPDYLEVDIASGIFDVNDPTAGGNGDTNDGTGPSGDGITDALEAWLIANGATGPITTTTDSDGDTVPDWIEIYEGTDPFDASSVPTFGTRPRAENVSVTGTLIIGREVTGSYTYVDNEGDPEGATTVKWYRDNVEIPGETTVSLVVNPSDIGATLRFEVTPVSDFAYPASTSVGFASAASRVVPTLEFPIGEGGPGGLTKADGIGPLELWMRPEQGLSHTIIGGEDIVTTWFDQSGYDNHAFPSGDNPTYVPDSGLNGLPTVAFDAASLEIVRTIQDDFTLFAVFSTVSDSGQDPSGGGWVSTPAIFGGEDPNGTDDFHLGVNQGQGLMVARDSDVSATTLLDDGAPHSIEGVRGVASSPGVTIYVDSVSEINSPLAGGMGSLDDSSMLQIGASTPIQGFFKGNIYELVIWSKILGSGDRLQLSNYIYGKYGIVPARILYNEAVTHGREVAGFGRDNFLDITSAAEGHGILEVSNPSALTSSGDFLFWGTDLPRNFSLSTEVPGGGLTHRWLRTWAFTESNGADGNGLGTVDLRFRLNGLSLPTDAGEYAVLYDADLDFSDATVFTTGATYDPIEETITFTGFEPTGVAYFTLAFVLP